MRRFLSLVLYLFVAGVSVKARAGNIPEIAWGSVSNDFRLGVRIQTVFAEGTDVSNHTKHTTLFLGTTNTAQTNAVFRPEEAESFKLVLRDHDGKEVAKTRLGKRFGNIPAKLASAQDRPFRQWRILIVPAPWDTPMASFNLVDHFKITEPGYYELTVEARVYKPKGQGQLELQILPTCTLKFRFEE